MTKANPKKEIADSLRKLAASYANTMRHLERSLEVLSRELELEGIAPLARSFAMIEQVPQHNESRPIADRASLSVWWRGKSCVLGDTLPFRLIERLLRRPNKYFSYEELLEDVWETRRSAETIRSTVKVLKKKLSDHGMTELANAIDGQHRHHYGLMLDRIL